jgi:uncharacterized protein YwgA
MTPKDWTLLVIASRKGKPLQPVQLQKSLFLLERNLSLAQLKVESFYQFERYDYGPFCSKIYSDAETLCIEGLVHIDRLPISYHLYSATEEGITAAKKIIETLSPEIRDYLEKVVEWTSSLSFNDLVSAIYQAYPEMKENSIFRE